MTGTLSTAPDSLRLRSENRKNSIPLPVCDGSAAPLCTPRSSAVLFCHAKELPSPSGNFPAVIGGVSSPPYILCVGGAGYADVSALRREKPPSFPPLCESAVFLPYHYRGAYVSRKNEPTTGTMNAPIVGIFRSSSETASLSRLPPISAARGSWLPSRET